MRLENVRWLSHDLDHQFSSFVLKSNSDVLVCYLINFSIITFRSNILLICFLRAWYGLQIVDAHCLENCVLVSLLFCHEINFFIFSVVPLPVLPKNTKCFTSPPCLFQYWNTYVYVLLFILGGTTSHGVKLLVCEVDHLRLLPRFKMLGDSPSRPLCFHIIETWLTLIVITSDVTADLWLRCGCEVCGGFLRQNIPFYIIR
jgi:hypothetical protein